MRTRNRAGILILVLVSTSIGGCLSSSGSSVEDSPDDPLVGDFEGLDYIECMMHEELERCWNVLVPSTVNLSEKVPMIIDLHGNTLTMEDQRALSEFDEIAEDNGAIAIWPQGFENSWNAGYCCSAAGELGLNDTGLIMEIVDRVVTNHSVDESRIYLTGWSNGCALSQKLANEHSDVFAAVACMSYYLLDDPEPNYSSIPVMEIHGLVDQIILYSNDAIHLPNVEAQEHGAIQNLLLWAEMNGCQGTLPDSNSPSTFYSIQSFTDCENGSEVSLVTLYAADHNPYEEEFDPDGPLIFVGNGGTVDTNGIAWEFMIKFSKTTS
jgi:polyhydroxybutyrate depolymerase